MNSLTLLKVLVEGFLPELVLNCGEAGATCFSPKIGLLAEVSRNKLHYRNLQTPEFENGRTHGVSSGW